MTYKLDSRLRKIDSPVILVFPDGTKLKFRNGTALSQRIFSEKYDVISVQAIGDVIEIAIEPTKFPDGEISLFDGYHIPS